MNTRSSLRYGSWAREACCALIGISLITGVRLRPSHFTEKRRALCAFTMQWPCGCNALALDALLAMAAILRKGHRLKAFEGYLFSATDTVSKIATVNSLHCLFDVSKQHAV